MKRAEAKTQGLEFYNTGKPCKYQHTNDRRTSSGKCLKCESEYNSDYGKNYYAENKDKLKAGQKQYRSENRDSLIAAKKQHYQENKISYKSKNAKWAKENKVKKNECSSEWREKNPEHSAQYGREWRAENPDKNRAKTARRRAARIKRTPMWLSSDDYKAIQAMYKEASRMTEATGVKHHVDHVIPLNGRFVSGLHVPDNLQILTAYANLSKGNQFNNIDRRI